MIALPGDRLQKATANSGAGAPDPPMGGLGFESVISTGRPEWGILQPV